MKKLVKVGLIGLFLLFILMQIWLPRRISSSLSYALEEELEGSQELSLKVNSFPAIKLLFGFVDRLEIRGEGVLIDDLPLRRMDADFESLRLKKVQDNWEVVRGKNTYLNLELLEGELNYYLEELDELKIFDNFYTTLLYNNVMMVGNIRLFNSNLNLQIEGDFSVANSKTILYRAHRIAVENIIIPDALIEQIKGQMQFEIDLSDLPFPLEIRDVKVREGLLVIN